MRWNVGLVVAIATVSCLSGCGDGPSLVPVSGTVTLNGKPLGEAAIVFIPDESNTEGQAGNDQTGPAGNYKAMTRGRSGLVPGKYKVVITKTPAVATSNVPDEFKDDPYMAQLVLDAGNDVSGGKSSAPKAPGEIKGEFECEVPPGGGPLDFDVKAAAPKG